MKVRTPFNWRITRLAFILAWLGLSAEEVLTLEPTDEYKSRTSKLLVPLSGLEKASSEKFSDQSVPVNGPQIEGTGGRFEVPAGSAIEFSFLVTGARPMRLAWLHQGQPLKWSWWEQYPEGLEGERLRLPALWEEQEGTYQLVAENAGGSARSELIELVVDDGVPIRFSPDAGVFTNSVTVDLSAVFEPLADQPHIIMYTIDGTEPSSRHGSQYAQPIVLTANTVIKARAVFWDTPLGRGHTASYQIIAPEPPAPGPDAHLIARYRFDDGEGLLASDEAGWEMGRLSAGGARFFPGGIEGGALALETSEGGSVELPGNRIPWGNPWSVAVWFRTQPGETRPMALLSWGGMDPSYGIYLALNYHGGTVAAHCGGGHVLTTDVVVNDGGWHHAVLSRSADGDTRIHVDGGIPRDRSMNGPVFELGVVGMAGGCGVGLNRFTLNGALDDLQIYSFQLLSDQVTFLASNPGATLAVPLREPPPLPQLIPRNVETINGWAAASPGDRLYLPFEEAPPVTSRYQWFHNGSPIPGATEPILAVLSVSASSAGVYHLVASNKWGQTVSKGVAVNVGTYRQIPQWSGLPTVVSVDRGGSVEFAPIYGEPVGATYQWFHNGQALPGAQGLTLRLNNLSPTDAGEYYSRVETADGVFWSKPSQLTVYGERAPVSSEMQSEVTPWEGESVEISTSFEGTLPIAYQWLKDGSPIAGATGPSLALSSVSPETAGAYQLQASNGSGSARGPIITLTPVPPPAILFDLSAAMAPMYVHMHLETSAPDLTIRYSDDGSEPTARAPAYSGGVYVRSGGRIQAAVFLGALRLGDTYGINIPQNPDYPRITSVMSDFSVDEGAFFALEVTAEGRQPLSYVWYKNGVRLTSSTFATSRLGPARMSDAGMYHVSVHNAVGSIESQRFLVSVTPTATEPPVIVSQPNDVTVSEDTRVVLSVRATGTEPLSYAWSFNHGDSVIGTLSNLVLTNARPDHSGVYQVRVTNSRGTVESAPARVIIVPRVRAIPVIVSQPATQTVPYGHDVLFEVRATSAEPMTYNWRFNGAAIPSETSRTLRWTSVTEARTGTYDVVVINRDGSVLSDPAILTVLPPIPPKILQAPGDTIADEGASLNLSITAEGTPPLFYRWFQNGELLSEFSGNTLGPGALTMHSAGRYVVEVSNREGSVVSDPFTLTVRARPPVITLQPVGVFVDESSELALEIQVTGTLPLEFQWRRDGVPIPNATHPVWRHDNARPSDSGQYDVVVSNLAGTVVSEPAPVTVVSLAGGTLMFVNRITGLYDAPVYDEDGITRLEGDAYRAQLYAGVTPDDLDPVGPSVPFRTGIGAGYWDPHGKSIRRIAAVQPGAVAWVQVRAWASADGPTFEDAVAHGGAVGLSTVFSLVTGGSGLPPSPPASLVELASFRLARTPPPEIFSAPTAQHLGIDEPLTLTVGARGSELAFQWYRDGEPLPGAASATFHVAAASTIDSGTYHVEVRNPGGVCRSSDIAVSVIVQRTLSLQPIHAVTEGGTVRLPLEFDSQGDVSLATVLLRFEPQVLSFLDLEWPHNATPVHSAELLEPGTLRIQAGDPAGIRPGPSLLGYVLLRVLEIADPQSTPLDLVDAQFEDLATQALLWGSVVQNTRLELLTRTEIGDNNANDILDLGDPTIIATLIETPHEVPKWVVDDHDANGDGSLDGKDVVTLLQRLVNQDFERLRPLSRQLNQGSPALHGVLASAAEPLLAVTADSNPVASGHRLRVSVILPAGSPSLRASAFTIRYPPRALSLIGAPILVSTGLLPGEVHHAELYEDASANLAAARIRFAVATAAPWSDRGGTLVDFEFQAQPDATLQPEWTLTLEDIQWTQDGFSIHTAGEASAQIQVRARTLPRFHSITRTPAGLLRLSGSGEPGDHLVLEGSDGSRPWTPLESVMLDALGAFDAILTDAPTQPARLFRLRDAPAADIP